MKREFQFNECPLLSSEESAGILLDYSNRRLAPELAAIFEQHMEKCPACRGFAESQRALWNALDAFEAMPVSQDFDRRLWARIEREHQGSWWSRIWNRMTAGGTVVWRPAIPVAAVLLAAVGLWMHPAWVSVAGPDASVAKVGSIEAEQIETALEDMDMLRQMDAAEAVSPQRM
ncbi:MAG: hypothetical protein HY235_30675 [Acidobacteria bacterium]|nr:hypothetical protein [Acidobacteriota bacterium]